jgi:hypothetical protein
MRARLLWLCVCGALWGGACAEEVSNQPPEFVSAPPETRGQANEELRFDVVAQDPDGDPVLIEMESGPPGADFVFSGFGRFFWTPAPTDAEAAGKRHDVVFVATDGRGGRASFRAAVVVTPSSGEARFTTSNSRVLDLSRDQVLKARVSVQADDLTEVPLALGAGAPAGMELSQDQPKSAVLVWAPSQAQVQQKLIWGATVEADVGQGAPVTQDVTVTLIAKSCGEGSTTVTHAPLLDQRAVEDYVIEAEISAASAEATLFWRVGGDPGDSGGFEGAPMQPAGGGQWRATIPNPRVQGEPVDLYYFIVAYTAADRDAGCAARSPEKGLHSFAAFAPGDESCRMDSFEPNDRPDQAEVIDERTQGVIALEGFYEVYGLALCGGEKDLFAVELEAGQGVAALITYSGGDGPLHLRGLGADGATVITESEDSIRGESSTLVPAASAGTYFVEVSGSPQGYQLFLNVREGVDPNCIDSSLEPNEDSSGAPNIPPGRYDDLKICPGDRDFFGIEVPSGFVVTVRADFSHAQGDLDLVLLDDRSQIVARAFSSTDDEELAWLNQSRSDSFVLQVRPVSDDLSVPYRLEIEVAEGEVEECAPDFFEPNDSADAVQGFPVDGGIDDFRATMCGDEDFYALDVAAGTEVSATITFDGQIADLDMELWDLDRRAVDRSNSAGSAEEVSYTTVRDGLHFVRVFRNGVSGVPEYTLNVAVGGQVEEGECAEFDTSEPNDDRNMAAPAPLEGEVENVGLCTGDEDWYVFQVSPNQTILALLEAIPIGGFGEPLTDIRLELVTLNGSVLAEAIESGDALDLQARIPNSEPHFLRVTQVGPPSDGFLYDLEMISF